MKFEEFASVQMWLKEVGNEADRHRYTAFLERFCRWKEKTPNELIDEAKQGLVDKGKVAIRVILEGDITQYLNNLEKRKYAEFTRLETEYAIRCFYQANNLPVETADVKKRIAQFTHERDREKKLAAEDRVEAYTKIAEKMGEELKDLMRAGIYHKYYVSHGQPRIRLEFEFYGEREHAVLDEPVQWFIGEIWKPQIERRIAALPPREYRSQMFQSTFYKRLAEKLGVNVEELWNKWLMESFRQKMEQLEKERPFAFLFWGLIEPDFLMRNEIDVIANATLDALDKKLREKKLENVSKKGSNEP